MLIEISQELRYRAESENSVRCLGEYQTQRYPSKQATSCPAKIFKEFGKDVWTLSCELKRPDEMRTIDLWKTVGLEDIQVAH